MTQDDFYMLRCIELAKKGLGNVAPNPMVGCVIVCNNDIIGEGYHKKFGEAHAEVNAIQSVVNKDLLPHSTLYVNLEPCSHFGKTPPCVDLILKSSIKRVIIGCVDPYAQVAGKGIARLRNHGCEVVVGVLKQQSLTLNRRFFTFHEKKRPFVILKWAQTSDGFIDKIRESNATTQPLKISSTSSQILVHKWRSEEAAIMVGTTTALSDNPKLNVRLWTGQDPLRIVIDQKLTLPKYLKLFDKAQNTWVINEKMNMKDKAISHVKIPFSINSMDFDAFLLYLHQNDIQSLLVEGGQKLLQSFLDRGIWDEARVFIAPTFLGAGVKAPSISASSTACTQIGVDNLFVFKNASNNGV